MLKNSFFQATALLAILAATLAAPAHANDRLILGEPAYGGSGCPAGSASVTISPEQSAISIIFDSYLAQAGSSTGTSIDRKNCAVAVPVHVPQGYSISVYQIDYRGFTSIPQGGMARFSAEYFFAGSSGPRQQRTFLGPANADYLLSNELGVSALVWSACGADTNLRINTSMFVKSNSRGDDVMATVDTADISSAIIYHIQWKRCR